MVLFVDMACGVIHRGGSMFDDVVVHVPMYHVVDKVCALISHPN